MIDVLFRIVGTVLIALVLFDVFKSVIVPRITSTKWRIAPFLIGRTLWPMYKKIALSIPTKETSEAVLDTYAPLAFVILMLVWLFMMVLGYALLFFSFRNDFTPHIHSLREAFYYAGSSVVTIGFSNVLAATTAARAMVLLAALCGLVFMALEISFLFTIQTWLQHREQVVNTLSSRAGIPSSGLVLLLRYKELKIVPTLGASFLHWEAWAASILESHRAYPLLVYFRSSNKRDSWVSSMGAMLDAASLLFTSIEDVNVGEADLFYWLSCTTAESICQFLRLPTIEGIYLTKKEYMDGLSILADAGYTIKSNERAWQQFSARRAGYMGNLIAIAKAFALPMHTWIPGFSLVNKPAEADKIAAEV